MRLPKLSARGQKFLKLLHLLMVACWVGGAASLVVIMFMRYGVAGLPWLAGLDMSAHLIDWWIVVVLGAIGSLVTGLAMSLFTGWGFFKHRWLLLKWIITIACIVFGTVALGPWEEGLLSLSLAGGPAARYSPEYTTIMSKQLFGVGLQVLCLVFMAWLSVFKPGRQKKKP